MNVTSNTEKSLGTKKSKKQDTDFDIINLFKRNWIMNGQSLHFALLNFEKVSR